MPEEPNYFAHAFKSQYNLIGLGTAVGFALLAGSGFPLILAAGAQLVILPLVAGSARFQRLVRARVMEDVQEERAEKTQVETAELLRSVSENERQRYRGLETLAAEIRRNYRGLDASSQMLLDDLVQKLEFLLSFYLRMRSSVARYEAYFSTTDPERIQPIKAKTRAVLEKRLLRYHKALENKQLIDAQTETVLEVLQLLRDQSYSMRDPREITSQLDGLVSSAEETERGVRDMEDILSSEQDLMMPEGLTEGLDEGLGPVPARDPEPTPRVAAAVKKPAVNPALPSPPPPPRKKLVQ